MKHPHADLIKQMVDDDTLRATYGSGHTGKDFGLTSVVAYPNYDWRLVPPKPKTITIVANNKTYELPEPMRVAPKRGFEYFLLNVRGGLEPEVWDGIPMEYEWLKNGVMYATREAAQQWVDAMAEIRGAK